MTDKIAVHGIDSNWLEEHDIHRFSHKAMATVFDILIYHDNYSYALQAATESFAQLDLLEQDLSRFVVNSDISRINQLKPGESTVVGVESMECLVICQRLQSETNGAFNPTVGKVIDRWKNETESVININENIGNLILDSKSYTVTLIDNPISIDLGGIGKGYALDKLKVTFQEWGIETILINSGRSTFLAVEAPKDETGWPLTISHPSDKSELKRISLNKSAIAGSGIEKGNHIVSPSNYQPVQNRLGAWSVAKTGAEADALSTSFMIMSEREIIDYMNHHPDVGGMVFDEKGSMRKFGTFE